MQITGAGVRIAGAPTGEERSAFSGHARAGGILQKKHVRSLRDDDATIGEHHAGWDTELVGKNRELVGNACALGVFADGDAIMPLTGRLKLIGIIERFGDPQPTPLVEGHADRFFDVRITGEKLRFKTRSHRHVLHRFRDADRFLHFGNQRTRPTEIIREFALPIRKRLKRWLCRQRPVARRPFDAALDQILKIRVRPRPFIVAPRRVKHTAIPLIPNPRPRLLMIPFNPIRQNRPAFRIELRMRIRFIPILNRVQTLLNRMIRQNDRLFKHTCGMMIEPPAHQRDHLR